MKTENLTLTLGKYFIFDTIKHILYWPIWWYSSGFIIVLKSTGRKIVQAWKGLALDIWLKNIFRPMYGQYDVVSRLISFIMRFIQIIFRFIIMIIVTLLILLLPIIYLGLPILIVWQIIYGK